MVNIDSKIQHTSISLLVYQVVLITLSFKANLKRPPVSPVVFYLYFNQFDENFKRVFFFSVK
jgi:hypothetical protein